MGQVGEPSLEVCDEQEPVYGMPERSTLIGRLAGKASRVVVSLLFGAFAYYPYALIYLSIIQFLIRQGWLRWLDANSDDIRVLGLATGIPLVALITVIGSQFDAPKPWWRPSPWRKNAPLGAAWGKPLWPAPGIA